MILSYKQNIFNIFVIIKKSNMKKYSYVKNKFSKMPAHSLRLINATNVCESGITESAGTSIGLHYN
jgi:hypothetical protein